MPSYKLLIAYPYRADSRTLVRLALEMFLLVILAVIITTAVYIIRVRRPWRDSEEKAEDPPSDIPTIKAAHARTLRPSIVREESMERPLESSVAAHSLNSYIFDLLRKISAQYDLDSLSLYLKNRQNSLSKTYELKGKRFLKIDSDTFETMDIDNELGRELKALRP
jgi:hypothetical protein